MGHQHRPPRYLGGYNSQAHRSRFLLLDTEKLHLENQRAVGWNGRCGAVRAVGKAGRNLEFEFVAHFHELNALGPAGNDAVQGKTDRLPALNGAVKYGAVEQCAVIMHVDRVRGFGRNGARALFEHLIFESAGSYFHFTGLIARCGRCRNRIAGGGTVVAAGFCRFVAAHEANGRRHCYEES